MVHASDTQALYIMDASFSTKGDAGAAVAKCTKEGKVIQVQFSPIEATSAFQAEATGAQRTDGIEMV